MMNERIITIIIIIIIIIIIMTLFRCHVYLAGQRPTNLGHHLYHSKVDRDLSHDRHIHIDTDMSPRAYSLMSLSEEMQSLTICRCKSKGSTFSLIILRPQVLVRPGIKPKPPESIDCHLTNKAN